MIVATATNPALGEMIAGLQARVFPLRILGVLANTTRPEGLSTPEIADRLGATALRTGRALATLHDSGLVIREPAEDPRLPPKAYRWRLVPGLKMPGLMMITLS